MFYLIQSNIYKEHNYYKLLEMVKKMGLDHDVVDTSKLATGETFDYQTDRKDVFVFGSVKLARLATRYDWHPASLCANNQDYEIYSKYYKENLLNYDSTIHKFTDDFGWSNNQYEQKFIRPCKDSKVITGALFTRAEWEDTKYEKLVSRTAESILTEDTLVQVSVPKEIYWEARLFIVGGKIITNSFYKFSDNFGFITGLDDDALEFGQRMVDIYQPFECFVMDICNTPNGYRIVEINNIASAGFYDIDMQKLLVALEDYYNPIQ